MNGKSLDYDQLKIIEAYIEDNPIKVSKPYPNLNYAKAKGDKFEACNRQFKQISQVISFYRNLLKKE